MDDDRVGPPGCLTTNEVLTLTGVTRKQLGNYIKKGILAPAVTSKNTYSEKLWTLEQVALVRHIPTLTRANLTLDEIANLADQGMQAINARLKAQYMREMRVGRRRLKDIVYRNREVEDAMNLGRIDTQYLRYLPQRWMALAPSPDGGSLPGMPGYALLYADLYRAAQVMGWSLTESAGAIVSKSADGLESSGYLFIELASPPMPAFTGHRVIDGGCYRVIDSDHGSPGCDGTRCEECARFGRQPTDAEAFDWKMRQTNDPDLGDQTVMVDDLDEPYATGMWSEWLEQRLGKERPTSGTATNPRGRESGPASESDDGKTAYRQPKSCTVKPRLMPHEVRLPLGMSACVMPAGVYLCYQCDEGEQRAAYERVLGLATGIEHRKFTLEDEIFASENSTIMMERDNQQDKGPVAEPFAIPRAAGDPALAGWHHEADIDVLRKLVVPTDMALDPEDGCCVTCAALPSIDRNDPARYEIQLLVDAPEFTHRSMFAEREATA